MKTKFFVYSIFVFQLFYCTSPSSDLQTDSQESTVPEKALKDTALLTGAERMDTYLPLLSNKNIGLVVNQTSQVGTTHLVDTLLSHNVPIKAIFAPEHGFRGAADAGEKLGDGIDDRTGIPLRSLYGSKKRPTREDLADIDLVVFDIQDVGARFYTYISTMHYVMDACAEYQIPFIVLDRPNPNGFYVDGPLLDTDFQSFVGMHPVPIVHGMTIGEYAQMINGESWLSEGRQCPLTVISCQNYDHNTHYSLPVKPSPNLPNMRAIYLYPSICFFEGTVASEGRGTNKQFQVYGHPDFPGGNFTFTPTPMPGAQHPKLEGKECRGFDLTTIPVDEIRDQKSINLRYFIEFYQGFPNKDAFFLKSNFIDKLAGGETFRKAVVDGKTSIEIKESWQEGLMEFKKMRKQYLLYPDFD